MRACAYNGSSLVTVLKSAEDNAKFDETGFYDC